MTDSVLAVDQLHACGGILATLHHSNMSYHSPEWSCCIPMWSSPCCGCNRQCICRFLLCISTWGEERECRVSRDKKLYIYIAYTRTQLDRHSRLHVGRIRVGVIHGWDVPLGTGMRIYISGISMDHVRQHPLNQEGQEHEDKREDFHVHCG